MGKIHTCIVNEKVTDSHEKLNYLKILMTVLRTLWLKCSAIQFTFFDNALTEVPVNTHQNIDCSLSTQFSDLVNAPLATITVNMKKELQRKIQDWENTNCIDSRPTLNLIN